MKKIIPLYFILISVVLVFGATTAVFVTGGIKFFDDSKIYMVSEDNDTIFAFFNKPVNLEGYYIRTFENKNDENYFVPMGSANEMKKFAEFIDGKNSFADVDKGTYMSGFSKDSECGEAVKGYCNSYADACYDMDGDSIIENAIYSWNSREVGLCDGSGRCFDPGDIEPGDIISASVVEYYDQLDYCAHGCDASPVVRCYECTISDDCSPKYTNTRCTGGYCACTPDAYPDPSTVACSESSKTFYNGCGDSKDIDGTKCPSGKSCVSDVCHWTCEVGAGDDCPAGEHCRSTSSFSGSCEECLEDDHCSSGEVCDNNYDCCTPSCASASSVTCGETIYDGCGNSCGTKGTYCSDSSKHCVSGSCVPKCDVGDTKNKLCDGSQLKYELCTSSGWESKSTSCTHGCDPYNLRCYACTSGTDCEPGLSCVNNYCRCVPNCQDKCGGASDGCGGTCDAACDDDGDDDGDGAGGSGGGSGGSTQPGLDP